ncbi:MAG: hypothetical protein ACXVHX_37645, partial [Solirubrobacteraceae bacterium]
MPRDAYNIIEGRGVAAAGALAAPRERAAAGRVAAESLRDSRVFRNTLRRARGRTSVFPRLEGVGPT